MSQENSDKSIPTVSPETGDVDPPTVSSAEPANAGYEYYEETEPAAEPGAEIYYYDEEHFSEEQTKPSSSTHTVPPLPPTPPKRESGSIAAAPMEVTTTTAQHTGWLVVYIVYSVESVPSVYTHTMLLTICCNRMFGE